MQTTSSEAEAGARTNGAGALSGTRVLEVAHAIAGPHGCQILADHGADVVKVEPFTGERARTSAPFQDGESLYYVAHNRGKRSISLDLKTERGLEILLELADRADVLVTNFTPGVAERLGFGWEVLSRRNPALVMVQITGFPEGEGPSPISRVYDGALQSMSGIADLTGSADGPPMIVGTFIADHLVAYQTALAVMFALEERRRTGRGERVILDMFTCYLGPLAHEIQLAASGVVRKRNGNRIATAFGGVFPTSDGYVYFCPGNAKMWAGFVQALDRPDWAAIPYAETHGARRDELEVEVAEWTHRRTKDDVVTVLQKVGVPCAPVFSVAEAVSYARQFGDDTVAAARSPGGRDVLVAAPAVRVGLAAPERRRRLAALGEDSVEILAELGLSDPEIKDLEAGGVVKIHRADQAG